MQPLVGAAPYRVGDGLADADVRLRGAEATAEAEAEEAMTRSAERVDATTLERLRVEVVVRGFALERTSDVAVRVRTVEMREAVRVELREAERVERVV